MFKRITTVLIIGSCVYLAYGAVRCAVIFAKLSKGL